MGRPLTGWSTRRQGKRALGATIQQAGIPPFPMPPAEPGDRPPSTRQVAFARVVSARLRVAIHKDCLVSARSMRAFLDHYADAFEQALPRGRKAGALTGGSGQDPAS